MLGRAAGAPGAVVHGLVGRRWRPLVTVLLGLPVAFVLHRLRFPGRRAAAGVRADAVRDADGGGRGRLPARCSRPSGPLGALRPRRHPGGDRRRDGVLQPRRRGPHRRVALGGPRPAPRGGRGRARRLAARRCSARSRCRRCCPAIVSAASVVFLFCATAFGVVLTLGGLRYATVETEIYLLTTQFLDLRAAAALSVLQLARGHRAAVRRPADPRRPRARRSTAPPTATPPAGRDGGTLPALAVTALVLVLVGRAAAHPGAPARCGSAAAGPRPLPRLATTGGGSALLVPVVRRRSRTRGGSPSTPPCSRCCSACWSRSWSPAGPRRAAGRRGRRRARRACSCCRSASPR